MPRRPASTDAAPDAPTGDDQARRDPQLLKGVLPMLVLALLDERESYGYELVVRLQDRGLTDIATGTVYPVLTRLEREGAVVSRLEPSPAGPARKYYLPSDRGRADLARALAGWRALVDVVEATVQPSTGTGSGVPDRSTSTAPTTTDQEPR